MIIDIDIQVSDENGKRIHRFAKRFDENTNTSEDFSKSTASKGKFEEFLAEYLSASGRTIRDKLINDLYPYNSNLNNNKNFKKFDFNSDKAVSDSSDGELEYKISIGNRSVLIGKIPLQRFNRLAKLSENLNKREQDNTIQLDEIENQKIASHDVSSWNYITPGFKEIKEIESSLSNLMTQALQKYESSFYLSNEENEQNRLENLG